MKHYIVEKYSYEIGKSSDKSYKVYYAGVLETEDLRIVDGDLEFTHADLIMGSDDNVFTREPYEMRTVESQALFFNIQDATDFYNDYMCTQRINSIQ